MIRSPKRDNSAPMRFVAVVLGLGLLSCGSGGAYGHSRIYSPLSDEESAAEGSTDYDPVMAKRSPEKWKGKSVSAFGVVVNRASGPAGASEVKLSLRTLETRNLCESPDDDTCRVTISEHEHAVVHAMLHLKADDDIGEHSVGPGSLIRVIGVMADAVDPSDGEPVLEAKYYRHWPRGYYVTTAERKYMRQ
jgi:hypothetical protein